MTQGRRRGTCAGLAVALVAATAWTARPLAHKPITSPYTFTEHVLPILREHCQACHVADGVGPMALETHEQTVPWAESIRLELISGHMPPWPVDASRGRFRHARTLTARELDVVLTWASGGTPPGGADPPPTPRPSEAWPLGPPHQTVVLPAHTLGAGTTEDVAEFQVPIVTGTARWLSAVDVRPGTPAMVRGVTVTVQTAEGADTAGTGLLAPERVAASWVPGDPPVPLPAGVGVRLPAGATLSVRVRYKKTWQYERDSLTETTSIGLYFTADTATPLMRLTLGAPGAPHSTTITSTVQVLALSVAPGTTHSGALVDVRRPDGTHDALVTLRPERGWARRYWFERPLSLPAGSVVTLRPRAMPTPLLPAPSVTPAPGATAADAPRILLHVVPG